MLTSPLGGHTVGLPIHLPPFQICCPHNTQHTRLGLQGVTQEHPSPDYGGPACLPLTHSWYLQTGPQPGQ